MAKQQVVVSRQHGVMVMPADPRVMSVVPGTKQLPDGRIAVPHDETTTRFVRNLGFTAPAPVLCYYDWGGDTPFATQKTTAALLTMNSRAYVLSEMGTGKTRGTLHAVSYLHAKKVIRRVLVVAPLSTLTNVWDYEIFRYFPHLSTTILHGDKKKRLKRLAEDKDIYIINHDGIGTILDELVAKLDIDCVIIDELATFRNTQSTRWKNLNKVLAGRLFAWGLTGSPTPTEPTDAFGQVKLLTPARAPKHFGSFRRETMVQVSPFRWIAKREAKDIIHDLMQPAVRYKRDDCVELPPTSYVERPIPLSSEQARVYGEMMKKLKVAFKEGTVTAVNEGVLFSKLLQVASGWVYTADRRIVDLNPQPRLDALTDILDAAEGKVIVFADFIHTTEHVAAYLRKQGYSLAQVSGATPAGVRNSIFSAFQNTDSPRVLVMHPRCSAHGLTLTAASIIVWFTPTTSLEIYEQACARITRPGQTRKTLILNLAGTPVETKLYKRLAQKSATQGALLEMFE